MRRFDDRFDDERRPLIDYLLDLEREWRWTPGVVVALVEQARTATSKDAFIRAAALELTVSGVRLSSTSDVQLGALWNVGCAVRDDKPARRRGFSA